MGNLDLIPGSERSPGEGNSYPLQYSCLEIPWTEEAGGPQSMGSQRVGHNWVTFSLHFQTPKNMRVIFIASRKKKLPCPFYIFTSPITPLQIPEESEIMVTRHLEKSKHPRHGTKEATIKTLPFYLHAVPTESSIPGTGLSTFTHVWNVDSHMESGNLTSGPIKFVLHMNNQKSSFLDSCREIFPMNEF